MNLKELFWIDFLKKKVTKNKDVLVGIGDDCALVTIGKEKIILASDLFIEGIHFKRKEVSFETIGKRAVGRVLSDFASCAGTPKFIGISIGVPAYIKEKDLQEILKGVIYYTNKYKFSLIGGDTGRAPKLFLDVWGVGVVEKFIRRDTAKVGDYIFLTGIIGKRKFSLPFEPRIKEAKELVRNFKINAMIDISDGFIIDLFRVLKESKKGAILYRENIPLTKGESDFYRGEDYELIFTVDRKEPNIDDLKKKFYFVGEIRDKKFGYNMEKNGKSYKVRIRGYTHF